MAGRICKHCRFHDDAESKDGFGECHRHAPRVHIVVAIDDPMEPTAVWPSTLSDDWCGEFEERRQ